MRCASLTASDTAREERQNDRTIRKAGQRRRDHARQRRGQQHDLATRRDIAAGIAQGEADAGVTAIVLTGAGRAFSGGADIKEFNTPAMMGEPNLRTLIDIVEASPKPVIAAVHGICLGGGLELSLGCHYRVAAKRTKIGLPEVKIGLVPGAGGTQRLPRALDVETALNMIATGEPVNAEVLAAIPGQALIDKLVDGDVLPAAIAFAGEIAGKRPLPRVRDRKAVHRNADGYFSFAKMTVQAMAKNMPAPAKCVDLVETAVRKRFDDGIAAENQAFAELLLSPEHHALRHAFFAERATSKIADVPVSTPTRPVKKVAVIGAGTMGGGISMNFAQRRHPGDDASRSSRTRSIAASGCIRKNYDSAGAKSGQASKPDKMSRSAWACSPATLDFKALDRRLPTWSSKPCSRTSDIKQGRVRGGSTRRSSSPGAILASNTSYAGRRTRSRAFDQATGGRSLACTSSRPRT